MRSLDLQMIENGFDVPGGTQLRIGDRVLRYVRWWITSGIECDAIVPPAEVTQLWFPASIIPCKLMYENRRPAGPCFIVKESDAIVCECITHFSLPRQCSG